MHYVLAISAASRRTKDQLADIRLRIPNVGKVRKADIGVHCTERPLCSLSFESERYGSQAHHLDGKAF